uniref:Uncharacterized protein n=1 Tax=Aegilops tauschii subsp. strangulata TaxID=200361 RepID=A0A453LIJ1_AEGTS
RHSSLATSLTPAAPPSLPSSPSEAAPTPTSPLLSAAPISSSPAYRRTVTTVGGRSTAAAPATSSSTTRTPTRSLPTTPSRRRIWKPKLLETMLRMMTLWAQKKLTLFLSQHCDHIKKL